MRPEARSQFDQAADALGLDAATRDRAWSQITALGLTPDDPTTIFLALSGKLDMAGAAFADLPKMVEAAARRAVGPVAEAAGKSLEARLAEQSQHTESAFRRMMGNFDGRTKAMLDEAGGRIAELAELRIGSAERAELMKAWAHVAGAVVLVAFVGGGLLGWSMYSAGYANGRGTTEAAASELAALASRPDAGTLLQYARNNDFNTATATWCGSGSASSMLVTVDGARRCGPFWYDAPPVVGQNATSAGAFWNMLNAPLRGFDPFVSLALGGAIVGALAWLRARFARR